MRRIKLLLVVNSIGMLLTIGCGGDNNVVGSAGDQFNVRYEVRFLNEGAVRINHKNNNGNETTNDPVTTNWEREYTFRDKVDAFLDIEVSEATRANSVTVQLAIYIEDNRVQQATSTITLDKKSTLSLTRP